MDEPAPGDKASRDRRGDAVADRRLDWLAELTRLVGLVSSSLELDEVLREIARAAARLMDAPAAEVWVADEAGRTLEARAVSDERLADPRRRLAFDEGLPGWVAAHRRPADVPDVGQDARVPAAAWFRDHGLRSACALPILHGDSLLGVLAMGGREPFRPGPEERALLDGLVAQAALAIRSARLSRASQAERDRLAALVDATRAMTRGLEVPAVLQAIAEAAAAVFAGEAGFRLLDGDELVAVASTPDAKAAMALERIRVGESAAGRVAVTGEPLVIPDVTAEPWILPAHREQAAATQRVGAVMCLPVRTGARVLGTLLVFRERGHRFDAEALRLGMSLADQGALALENARLHAEAETQRREAEALIHARDFLRSITEHSPDAIVTTDLRGSVTYWSPRAEELFGYRAAEVLGRPAADLQRPGVEGGPAALGPLEAEGPVGDHEVEVRARDGRWIECRASLAPLRDAEGRVTGTLAILHDVSERKRLEAQLRQAQKMEAVGRLAGGVAHDFNNLLAVIMGHGDLMRSVLEEDDPLLPEVDEIRRAAERAAGLTRQLLAFSRRQFLQPEIVDLNALLESVAGLLRRLLGEDVELELRLDPGAGCVSADRGQIEQVLMNLALNARDAMPGGGRLAVETAAVTLDPAFVREHPGSAPGPHVRLTIRDSGTGMTADVLAHLFEPFFTTKEPGRGTGLGLSTVYGIVKQHRGYVDAESEPGRGSTFRIFLPRVDAAVRPADPAAPAPAPGGRETVLFVEDAEVLRDLLQRVLAQGGYHVLAAADGLDALARVDAHAGPIDLVVTDVIMPGLSGPEFAARLRERRPGIRVLYVSGHAADALGEGPQPDGAFLAKPFTPHALLRKVREVLDAPPP